MRNLIILVAIFFSMPSQALDFEMGGGITRFKRAQNGTWYQEAFYHELELESHYWSVGVSHKFPGYPRMRLEFVNLGTASADAYAVPNDYNYSTNTNTCNVKCLPLAHYMSKGDVRGVAITAAPEWNLGSYKLYLEGGIYIFRPRYWATVTNVHYGSAEGEIWSTSPATVTIRHDADIQSSWVVGAGVSYKNVDLTLRIFDVGANDDDVPAVYRGASTLGLRFKF